MPPDRVTNAGALLREFFGGLGGRDAGLRGASQDALGHVVDRIVPTALAFEVTQNEGVVGQVAGLLVAAG
jgi:hypothetical protein